MILHSVQVYFFSYQRVVPLRKKNPFIPCPKHKSSSCSACSSLHSQPLFFRGSTSSNLLGMLGRWWDVTLPARCLTPVLLFLRNCDSLKVTLLHHCAYQPHLLPHWISKGSVHTFWFFMTSQNKLTAKWKIFSEIAYNALSSSLLHS